MTRGRAERIAILGAGSWGTALAVHLRRTGHDVRLWARDETLVEGIRAHRINPRYLTDVTVPEGVLASTDGRAVLDGARTVVVAVPSHVLRSVVAVAARLDSARRRARQRGKGPRDELAEPDVAGDRRRDARRDAGRRALGTELRARGRSRAADRRAGRLHRRFGGRLHPGVLPRPVAAALWQRRCGGGRDRRRAEERDCDCRRRRGRTGPRAQLDGRPDHARTRRDLAIGERRRRPSRDACRA